MPRAPLACVPRSPHALLALLILVIGAVAPAGIAAQGPPPWVADELLVGFHPDVPDADAETVYRGHGAAKIERLRGLRVHRIRVPPAALEAIERALARRPEVEFVERNHIISINATPDDPSYPNQWHLPKIDAPLAWDISTGAPEIVIAILDTGVDPGHPDLASKLVAGYNFYNNNTDTTDVHGHGTSVAGAATAAGNNGLGVAGVTWLSRIMPVRVTDPTGYTAYSNVAKGLTWAADHGAKVMNISISGVANSSTIKNAAQYVMNKGGVVVAGAGNCGCWDSTPHNPYMISVSATDKSDNLASWSSRGDYIDVSAPGVSILTTARGGGYHHVSGTSFSGPITAGVVALMMAANPSLDPVDLEQLLAANADDKGPAGWDPSFGFGRVNAYRAVAAAADSPSPDTAAPTVAISSPASGASVSGMVTISVSAADNVGVTRVELWIGGALAASRTAAPWAFPWDSTSASNGSHSLVARAYDAVGNAGTSAAVTVSVSNTVSDTTPPTVSISSPASGASVSGTVTVNAAASDNVGVTRVEFLVDGTLAATRTTTPWSFTWDTATKANGSRSLSARAYDAAGNVGSSATVSVNVNNGPADTTPPTVRITSVTQKGVNLTVTVDATDDVGVTRVDLHVGGQLESTKTAAPYTFTLKTNGYPRGSTLSLEAAAYDAAGNAGSSGSPTTITIK